MTKSDILRELASFSGQRPGLDPRNYISDWRDADGRRAYQSEVRAITRDLHDVRALMSFVAIRDMITADTLKGAFRAFSGRLTLREDGGLEYCTGQYWPTEYRKAVAAVLSAAIWDWLRDGCNCKTGDDIRRAARRELGRGIASRWFR